MRKQMTISLQPGQDEWVKEEMHRGGFATASEFFRHMIRERQQKRIRAQVEADLLEALDSPTKPMTKKDWEDVRREGRRRAATLKKKRV